MSLSLALIDVEGYDIISTPNANENIHLRIYDSNSNALKNIYSLNISLRYKMNKMNLAHIYHVLRYHVSCLSLVIP